MLELILIPVFVAIFTQAIKLLTDGIPKNFNWQHIVGDYGGMPSSHAAFVTSLATLVGLREGANSAAFAISVVLMIVVIRDAVGFRREIGRNATLTNRIAEKVFSKKDKTVELNEQMGHSFSQVIVGIIIGCALTLIFYALLLI